MRPARIAILFVLFCAGGGCGGDGGGSTGGTGGSSSTCGDGVCQSNESSTTCCTDCGCTGGLVCQGGTCVAHAPHDTCGDGVCGSSETQATCCSDCGCPGGETCSGGQCIGSCAATSTSCSVQNDCCNYRAGTGLCVNFGSGGVCADSCHANSDCASGCCQPTSSGHQVCSPAGSCISQPLGAACTTNSECTSGLCVNGGSGQGWCSERCASDSACPNSPYFMWCAQNNAGADICWANCTSNTDCAIYGASSTCQPVTTVSGLHEHICVG